MSWINVLRFKRLPRPLLPEEIAGVLEEHRSGGNLFNETGTWIVCRCGEKFPDGRGVNGFVLLRRHIAEEIDKLQRVQNAQSKEPRVIGGR